VARRNPFPPFTWCTALVLALLLLVAAAAPALAQQRISLIRDAEIEDTLDRITRPLFEAAGLAPDTVDLYIVNDQAINAFVAGGMNLFVNTGLLRRTDGVDEVAGVLAHEIGHIAGGHLSRIPQAQQRATAEAILGVVLGAAAAVAGAPELGTAIITGGQTLAQSGFLRFSRSQEQAADQAALSYLDRVGLSARGLLDIFRKLENQSALAVSSRSPYTQTHPLTRDRIVFVQNHVRNRPQPDSPPPGWAEAHERMVAKLDAFLTDPRDVLRRYADDGSLSARYARAIAHYRVPELARALAAIDELIAEHPDDPYFHELKGQMLFENGRIAAAIEPYREATRLRPQSALIRIGLARALIETGDEEANREAIDHLEEATKLEATNATAWRLLGIARGRAGQEGASALALAESALLSRKMDDARLYARRAEARIPPSDPAWLRLQDILRVIEEG